MALGTRFLSPVFNGDLLGIHPHLPPTFGQGEAAEAVTAATGQVSMAVSLHLRTQKIRLRHRNHLQLALVRVPQTFGRVQRWEELRPICCQTIETEISIIRIRFQEHLARQWRRKTGLLVVEAFEESQARQVS